MTMEELLKKTIWYAFLIMYCCSSLTTAELSTRADTDSLAALVVIYRHGDRTPVQPYPNDPYRNESFWPVPFGQLTNRGKAQHYRLGKWLRRRYDGFLPIDYSPHDIWVRATDVDRTLMSAASNLAGLYPPHGNQQWMPHIHWQPIPIHTVPQKEDGVLAMGRPCPRYDHELYQMLHFSEPFIFIDRQNRHLYEYLSRYSGSNVTDLNTLFFLYNVLQIEQLYNFTLPAWTVPVYPDQMKGWAELSFSLPCYTQSLARLMIGPLFEAIVSFFQGRSVFPPPPTFDSDTRFVMFSAHDTTLANILNALGAFDPPHQPEYASAILMELHRSNTNQPNKHHIQIWFRNSTVGLMPIQAAPNCSPEYCDFDEFLRAIAAVRIAPAQWANECRLGGGGADQDESSSVLWWFGEEFLNWWLPIHDPRSPTTSTTLFSLSLMANLLLTMMVIVLILWAVLSRHYRSRRRQQQKRQSHCAGIGTDKDIDFAAQCTVRYIALSNEMHT